MSGLGGVSASSNISAAYVSQLLASDASRKVQSTEKVTPVDETASMQLTPQTSSWSMDPEKLDLYM